MSKSQQGRENKVPKRVTKNESPAGSGRAPVREQVGPGMEPEDAQALPQRDRHLRYFALLVPMGRPGTLEFGKGDALCRNLRRFPASALL